MKYAKKLHFDKLEKEQRGVVDRTNQETMDMWGCVSKSHEIFNPHITRKRKAIEIFYDLFELLNLRDKDSSHEHHDLIVGKCDQEII